VSARVRLARSEDFTTAELAILRGLCDEAFGERDAPRDSRGPVFTDRDWANALGGMHAVAIEGDAFVAHASVLERELHVDGVPLRTGYVEAVATRPDRQRRGLGTVVMRALGEHIRAGFPLGGLDTSRHGFYERLGWERWLGPTSVRTDDGIVATPEEDGYVMILRTPSSPQLDLEAPISCEWRPGDVW
jgi:aminoglycoside 2'-N-acetyltransferase I